ncbi:hypothetical protein [Amycolatopsis sp. 3B14]|uniref:hypothetical protein n=1 Tax=Amycolatopsis sp. 3B14 TaxID=3243600 RepID=UPI003D964058
MIERRFLAMTAGPQPLTLDCAALGCGLPAEVLPLDEVRVRLLKRQTSWVTKDAVWQELVRRAHAEPEPWTTVAAAMMMPGLKHIGGKLGSRFPVPGSPATATTWIPLSSKVSSKRSTSPTRNPGRCTGSSTGPRSDVRTRSATANGDGR